MTQIERISAVIRINPRHPQNPRLTSLSEGDFKSRQDAYHLIPPTGI